MAEGSKDQEGEPIIYDLFPIGEKSVLAAFRDLSPIQNSSGFQAEADGELDILSQTNPHVLKQVVQSLLTLPSKEDGDQIFGGILVCHRALRKEAESQGVQLPTLTDEFTKRHYEKEIDNILAKGKEKKLSITQAMRLSKIQMLSQFENLEPQFSEIAKEQLGGSDWHPEENLGYLGIINFYLLFKEGCKDPKNFQQ